MRILGIESSCDDTSVALVRCSERGFFVISEKTASQIEVHKRYGGVVPEIAGRKHAENIIPVVAAVMEGHRKPDVIAVTAGPGLITGLVVGVEAAKTLSYLWGVPLVAVNHIEGHVCSGLIRIRRDYSFPALCLIVSGGHTELLLMDDYGKFTLIGKTRDDAAGEAFDKVGKLIGLDYPGGPKISKLAENGDRRAINFPRPMIDSPNFDFSFAGLKTAALYWLKEHAAELQIADFCASFEQAVVDVLVEKTRRAAEKYKPKNIILGGGVSANASLRKNIADAFPQYEVRIPLPRYAMDNGAMIAVAAYRHALKKKFTPWQEMRADPNWKVYDDISR